MAGKQMSKSDFLSALAEKTGLNKKQAAAALDAVNAIVAEQLKVNQASSSGKFESAVTVPGLIKLKVSEKLATEEKPGINPFTKQPITIKAKPARKVVKASPIKALKDAV